MKRFFTVVVFTAILGVTTLSAGPKGSVIMGQVVENDNYTPVASAVVSLIDSNNAFIGNVSTNDNGLFELTDIPYGDYSVRVSYYGCIDQMIRVSVSANQTDLGVLEVHQFTQCTAMNAAPDKLCPPATTSGSSRYRKPLPDNNPVTAN